VLAAYLATVHTATGDCEEEGEEDSRSEVDAAREDLSRTVCGEGLLAEREGP
jgi:hypothetical protein